KDVNVVGLADVVDRSAELERAEGTARGHDGPSVRPVQGLVRAALDLRGGIAHGQDDGAFDVPGHLADHLFAEDPGAARRADQYGRLHPRDDLEQTEGTVAGELVVVNVLARPAEFALVRIALVAPVEYQALRINHRLGPASHGRVGTILGDAGLHQSSDADAGCPGP